MYANPVYKKNWPQIMIDRVAARSEKEGLTSSRLPAFTDEEVDYVSGTYDFLAINHYTSYMVSGAGEPAIGEPSWEKDAGGYVYQKDSWEQAAAGWFRIVPWGIGKLMRWLKSTYGDLEIVVTENGVSDRTGTLEDDHRISYYKSYMSHLLDAMYDGQVNVTGYTAWSIIDNFEWTQGFNAKLGIYYVNMSDPERPRVPKKSSKYYANVIKTRCLLDEC
uniref:beta-glucosidase n=1 Tax=Anoplophora glabripennis TaxID=217634 RepID=V5GVG8_ANOGL